MQLYYHKTDGGAEYLTDSYVLCPNGHKEGSFGNSKYIVRVDGDITKDAELMIKEPNVIELVNRYSSDILDIIDDADEFTRSDLQGAVSVIVRKIINELK